MRVVLEFEVCDGFEGCHAGDLGGGGRLVAWAGGDGDVWAVGGADRGRFGVDGVGEGEVADEDFRGAVHADAGAVFGEDLLEDVRDGLGGVGHGWVWGFPGLRRAGDWGCWVLRFPNVCSRSCLSFEAPAAVMVCC